MSGWTQKGQIVGSGESQIWTKEEKRAGLCVNFQDQQISSLGKVSQKVWMERVGGKGEISKSTTGLDLEVMMSPSYVSCNSWWVGSMMALSGDILLRLVLQAAKKSFF